MPRRKWLPWIVLLLLAAAAPAQAPSGPPPLPSPSAADSGALSAPPAVKKEKKRKEPRISQADADELFRSVDEILRFVSDDTGLPIKHPVKRALASREQVEAFTRDAIEKGDHRSEAVLKKFGLLPRNFDLDQFLVDLMGEQVAGYYDTKTKTMYLLDWVRPEAQKAVLAHELTHALQDQSFDLDKWLHPHESRDGGGDVADEDSTTRRAVSEGQAMLTLVDYMLQRTGRRAAFSPEIIAQFRNLNADNPDFPLLKSAPLMLQEVLSFPYSYGLGFEYDLLLQGGKKRAFTDVFRHPPASTREIMEPGTYLHGEILPRLRFPKIEPLVGHDYRKYDEGAVGEFDAYVILKQFAGEKEAGKLSRKWRGGIYYAAQRTGARHEGAPQEEEGAAKEGKEEKDEKQAAADPATIALLYLSRWATAADARRFAADYALAVEKKYRDAKLMPPADPAVRSWNTGEGPVYVQTDGDRVVVTESFDAPAAAKLRAAVLSEAEPALPERH